MFLKCSTRRKDGKIHRSWSIVESRRVGRRVVQKHVLYLGEVNDRQRASWERAVSVIDETSGECRQLSLIPADRAISAAEVDALHFFPVGVLPTAPESGGEKRIEVQFAPQRIGQPAPAPLHLDALWRELH